MNYSSINIQGNIISSDILTKIRQDDTRFQKPEDFGLDRQTTVREEIGIAWGAAQAHWNAFKMRRDRLKETESGTSETRQSWIIPLMRELGYDLEKSATEYINEKSYPISHRAQNRDGFPVHVVGVNQSLDKRAEGGLRLSPHALVQEYLNNQEHLYAITTNGVHLRLLRDATRLARLTFLEFNLEQIMEEGLYAEFALLFRVLHATRMAEKQEAGAESIIEFYHQEALANGTRIRERLSGAVEKCLSLLANGLLRHPANSKLREKAENGLLKSDDYYLYLLRTVYRTLFLLVIEERHLIYPAQRDEALTRKRKIYYDYYSIQRLTKLVEQKVYVDPRKTDLWRSLMTTFLLFEKGFYGSKIGIQPLGSGLFSPAALDDLVNYELDNETFLKVLRHLIMFENEHKQWARVNYADLDVEEFGSVYEGLLEYDPDISMVNGQPVFSFKEGTGRSSSGSHYTPEELVKPLIKHSLDYVIEDKLKAGAIESTDRYEQMKAQAGQLLTIKVCDVACGSGHILLSAARRIGMELAILRESIGERTTVEQPSPTYLRAAIRDVIRHCIYGVDKNPLAVELCKVAMWLEAHNPGEPLNFLDHRIKCGDAIVGLAHKEELQNGIATEAFKALTEEEKEQDWARTLTRRNKEERARREKEEKDGRQLKTDINYELHEKVKTLDEAFEAFVNLPERTPKEIEAKQQAYVKLQNNQALNRLRLMANIKVGQFFLGKTAANKDYLVTDVEYFRYLKGEKAPSMAESTKLAMLAQENRFFHYFLEFPEAISQGGFDVVLGNPPYLGGTKITGFFGKEYLSYLKSMFLKGGNRADLVVYFLQRNYSIIKSQGFFSLITTNTVSQGDTRSAGLQMLKGSGGNINFAVKSVPWPGLAAVEVALLSVTKKPDLSSLEVRLNGQLVQEINSHFAEGDEKTPPFQLKENQGKSSKGSDLLGAGFVISEGFAQQLIGAAKHNKDVIYRYLNGDDVNGKPVISNSRYVINFRDLPLCKAKEYKLPFEHIQREVKPQRQRKKEDGKHVLRHPLPEKWWQFNEVRKSLYNSIQDLERVFVQTRVTKYMALSQVANIYTYSDALVVFSFNEFHLFTVLQSTLHSEWAWRHGSTMGISLRYSPSDCFQTFAFPREDKKKLEAIGSDYHEMRSQLMKKWKLGLTKLYNELHSMENNANSSDFANDIQKFRLMHQQLDEAVFKAYDWLDIESDYDFYEIEHLPENDRIRYTISPNARKEVLQRLLKLNHQRFEEEVQKGLHKKKDVETYYQQQGEPVPEGTEFSDRMTKVKKKKAKKSASVETETKPNLFSTEIEIDMKPYTVYDAIYTRQDASRITRLSPDKVKRWFDELAEASYEGLKESSGNMMINFHGVVELMVIGTLREAGIKLSSILAARRNLSKTTNKPYPFATNDVNDILKKSGRALFQKLSEEEIIRLNETGQYAFNFIIDLFDYIYFDVNGLAKRFFPPAGNKHVMVDPEYAGGRAVVSDHPALRAEIIFKAYKGPKSIATIRKQYPVSEKEVESIVAYFS